MKNMKIVLIMAIVMVFAVTAQGQYTPGKVTGGGTISGMVSYDGTAPKLKALRIEKDKKVCALHDKFKEELIVDAKGGLKNVVVYIETIETGKAWDKKYTLDQKGCRFEPHIMIVGAGEKLSILNSDKILHNIHTYSKINRSINKAQPKFKKKMSAKFGKAEFIRLRCDVHAWMSGWIVSSASPYYAVTDDSGNFSISDVPAGTYTLKYWHETLGEQSVEVTLTGGGTAKSDAKFSPKS